MPDYKNLNLNRDMLDENIKNFLTSNQYALGDANSVTERRRRISFGRAGITFAMVDLHLNQDGTTTIQWKLGKNYDLGKTLADYLKATIDPAELKSVNYSLQGITRENFSTIIELLVETNELEINETCHNSSKVSKLTSKRHQDQLTLSHHNRNNILQIQGRPLSCYRHVIYFLTDLLDLKGLEQVLYRKDDSSAEIVREEMAIDYLNQHFPKNYSRLPDSIKKLLISGCCIKLASPTLTDYSLLLYPDLRSLEGVLKQELANLGLVYSEAEYGFGDFFQKNGSSYILNKDFENAIPKENARDSFCKAYHFYNKNRHSLFHMEDFPDASRMTSQLQNAINLSKEIYTLIDDIYTAIYPS